MRSCSGLDENVLLASKQRYVLSDTAGVNEEELADLSRDIVHVAGRLGDESFRPLQTAGLQGNSLSYRNSRIEELKEISGNRDMTQGGTAGGVTAASAIAALQEAGSKLSRDMLKSAYRAFARECYRIIDLMRQFYDCLLYTSPFATPNETDFRNLMDVYLNAVFCPLAMVDKAVFEQEGLRRKHGFESRRRCIILRSYSGGFFCVSLYDFQICGAS